MNIPDPLPYNTTSPRKPIYFVMKRILLFFLCLLPIATPAICLAETTTVTILASSSLNKAMPDIIREYSIIKDTSVSIVFGEPDELANQIESGDPGNIYIAEHPVRMRDLQRKGLIDFSAIANIAFNRLVLVIPSDSYLIDRFGESLPFNTLLERASQQALIVMGNPYTTPVGILTQRVMEKLNIWQKIQGKVEYRSSSRDALYLVAKGGKHAGIVYYTDAFNNREVSILARFPQELHDPVIYRAAVIAGASMQEARDFLAFLTSPKAKRIFTKHGYTVPEETAPSADSINPFGNIDLKPKIKEITPKTSDNQHNTSHIKKVP